MARGTQKEVRIWLEPEELERLDELKQVAGEKRLGRFISNQIEAGFKSGATDIADALAHAKVLRDQAEAEYEEIRMQAQSLLDSATQKEADAKALLESLRREKEQVYARVYELISRALDAKMNGITRAIGEGMKQEFQRQSVNFGHLIEQQSTQLLEDNERFYSQIIAGLDGGSATETTDSEAPKLAGHLVPDRK